MIKQEKRRVVYSASISMPKKSKVIYHHRARNQKTESVFWRFVRNWLF